MEKQLVDSPQKTLTQRQLYIGASLTKYMSIDQDSSIFISHRSLKLVGKASVTCSPLYILSIAYLVQPDGAINSEPFPLHTFQSGMEPVSI